MESIPIHQNYTMALKHVYIPIFIWEELKKGVSTMQQALGSE